MASTYLSLHYHRVFGTKHREPIIAAPWRLRLHEHLGGTIVGLGGFSQGIGGVDDHVHLLVGLKAFTVSAPAREAVQRYIANQEQHHRRQSFRDELIGMLHQAGIEFDPPYLD